MTQTILDGGSKTQQDQYTGPANELTVDTSNQELRLHDGSTPGGHIIQNRDGADQRYQAKSTELDGLNGFQPSERGFPVRRAPGAYAIRSITVNGANLAITNGDGYAGDPLIGLAATITSDHTWDGQHIFNDVVQFNAGINADVSGDTFGLHTGNVVGNVTGNTTGSHVGPVDLRTFALQLDANQIPYAAINGLRNYIISIILEFMPVGIIAKWSGSAASIPANWRLCDGTGGTPDLRNKFVLGAGAVGFAVQVGMSGGSDTHGHTASSTAVADHTHAASSANTSLTVGQMPAHSHFTHKNGVANDAVSTQYPASQEGSAGGDTEYRIHAFNGQVADVFPTDSVGGGAGHNHAVTINNGGGHSHPIAVANTTQLPPYYALCYIMRV